jgi:NTP pyrophosphatase (non-canonical NTP hydrolase)
MKEFSRLIGIMRKLRHPRSGCPWDLKQTPDALKEYILEEAHELIEAIDGGRKGRTGRSVAANRFPGPDRRGGKEILHS